NLAAAPARLSPPPGARSSGDFTAAHERYVSSNPPSNEPKWISLSSGTTMTPTSRPSSASASVSCVRESSVVAPRATRSAARSARSARACSTPSGTSPSPGTAHDAIPSRFEPASPCRARISDSMPLEQERSVVEHVLHPDRLVQADRRRVLGADEETHGRDDFEEFTAEVGESSRCVAEAAHRRIHPHLLELHRRGRPRRRLGLEEDDTVLLPEPRSLLLDLAARTPAEAVGVPAQRVEPELLLVRRSARRHQELQVVEGRGSEPCAARRGRLADHEDGLTRSVLAWPRQPLADGVPQVGHRAGLSDQHPRRCSCGLACEGCTAVPGRDDVDPEVAQRI